MSNNPATPAARELRMRYIPARYQALAERSWEGQQSPRQAIKAKCLECVGYEAAEVTLCTATLCPLWMLRPYRPHSPPPGA